MSAPARPSILDLLIFLRSIEGFEEEEFPTPPGSQLAAAVNVSMTTLIDDLVRLHLARNAEIRRLIDNPYINPPRCPGFRAAVARVDAGQPLSKAQAEAVRKLAEKAQRMRANDRNWGGAP